MPYNRDRAIGCCIGYNAIIAAVRHVDKHGHIPPTASRHLRRVLREIYGEVQYKYYRSRRPKLRVVA